MDVLGLEALVLGPGGKANLCPLSCPIREALSLLAKCHVRPPHRKY
jgi:hypothetical protein